MRSHSERTCQAVDEAFNVLRMATGLSGGAQGDDDDDGDADDAAVARAPRSAAVPFAVDAADVCPTLDPDCSHLREPLEFPRVPSPEFVYMDLLAIVPVINLPYITFRDRKPDFERALHVARPQLRHNVLQQVSEGVAQQRANAMTLAKRFVELRALATRSPAVRIASTCELGQTLQSHFADLLEAVRVLRNVREEGE